MKKIKRIGLGAGLILALNLMFAGSGCFAMNNGNDDLKSMKNSVVKTYGVSTGAFAGEGFEMFESSSEKSLGDEARSSFRVLTAKDNEGSQKVCFKFSIRFDKRDGNKKEFFNQIGDKVSVQLIDKNGDVKHESVVNVESCAEIYSRQINFNLDFSNLDLVKEKFGNFDLDGLKVVIKGGPDLTTPIMYTKIDMFNSAFKSKPSFSRVLNTAAKASTSSDGVVTSSSETATANNFVDVFNSRGEKLDASETSSMYKVTERKDDKKPKDEVKIDFEMLFDKEGSTQDVFKNVGSQLRMKIVGADDVNWKIEKENVVNVGSGENGFAKKISFELPFFEIDKSSVLNGVVFYFYDLSDVDMLQPLFYAKTFYDKEFNTIRSMFGPGGFEKLSPSSQRYVTECFRDDYVKKMNEVSKNVFGFDIGKFSTQCNNLSLSDFLKEDGGVFDAFTNSLNEDVKKRLEKLEEEQKRFLKDCCGTENMFCLNNFFKDLGGGFNLKNFLEVFDKKLNRN